MSSPPSDSKWPSEASYTCPAELRLSSDPLQSRPTLPPRRALSRHFHLYPCLGTESSRGQKGDLGGKITHFLPWRARHPKLEIWREGIWIGYRLRELDEWRKRVVNLVSDIIQRCMKAQNKDEGNGFWKGWRFNAVSMVCKPDDAVYHLIIYGEIFGAGMREWLENNAESEVPGLVKTVRSL